MDRPSPDVTVESQLNKSLARIDNITTCTEQDVPKVYTYYSVCYDIICIPLAYCITSLWYVVTLYRKYFMKMTDLKLGNIFNPAY